MESTLPEGWPKNLADRKKLFSSADPNGNGLCSLAELDKMIETEKIFDTYRDKKPVIMRAYKKADEFGGREGLITRKEFRKFLEFLPIYHKLWAYFDAVDTDDDRRVDLEEFKKGAEHMGELVGDAEAEFSKIDANGGGQILFDEFCNYFINKVAAQLGDEE
jgi:Ca2+-binding EF-hand superfamily protein